MSAVEHLVSKGKMGKMRPNGNGNFHPMKSTASNNICYYDGRTTAYFKIFSNVAGYEAYIWGILPICAEFNYSGALRYFTWHYKYKDTTLQKANSLSKQ